MGTMKIAIEPLSGAIANLKTLGTTVRDARVRINNNIPNRADISTLTTTGSAGTFTQWTDDQVLEPLQAVLDIGRLLDTEASGEVTYTYTGEYSAQNMTDNLSEMLVEQLSDEDLSAEELERVLGIADNHADNDDVQTSILDGLGPAGVASLLRRSGEAGIEMEKVTGVFSEDSHREIADWARDDIIEPENIDVDTTALMAGFAKSEAFSEGLYDNVTPDQMADAIQYLNSEAYNEEFALDDGGNKTDQLVGMSVNADEHAIYQQFLNAAGTSFATYTHAVSSPTALADTWFDAITDDDQPGNASALTLLMRKGGENAEYDPDFLYKISDDLYEWEKDQDSPVWGPRDEGVRLLDPDIATSDSDAYHSSEYKSAIRSDGLANILGSMANTPEAAQRFFAEGYENGDPGGTNERVEYLLEERTFSKDHLSDEGYGLGAALEAAAAGNTTDEYVSELGMGSDEWSAGFATDLFEWSAEMGGTGQDKLRPDYLYWGYPGTSVALGNIGAAYADDIYMMLADSDSNRTPNTDGHGLEITDDQLEGALKMIGVHDDISGLETLSAALLVEGNDQYRLALEGYQPAGERDIANLTANERDGLKGILGDTGTVLGDVTDLGLAGKDEEERQAEHRAAIAATAFDVAAGFIPGAGDVASGLKDTLWETAIDTGKDQGVGALKDMIKNAPEPNADQIRAASDEEFQNLIQYNTYDQLLATGYLDSYEIDPVLYEGEGDNRRFVDDVRGVGGVPPWQEAEGEERDRRIELQDGVNELLNEEVNYPPSDTPPEDPLIGDVLDAMLGPAYDKYDQVMPNPEDS